MRRKRLDERTFLLRHLELRSELAGVPADGSDANPRSDGRE